MPELSVLEAMDRYSTLGPDFLTWICVHTRREDFTPPPSEPGLEVSVLGPLTLESDLGEATKVTLSGDEAAASPELAAALKAGKKLARAKLEFTAQDSTWTFSIDSETFDLKSMKLPVPKIPDLDEYMSARVQAVQHLSFMLGEMFEMFLAIRLDPARWREEIEIWQTAP